MIDDSNALPGILDRSDAFLAKPFSVELLGRTVRDLIAENKGAHGPAGGGRTLRDGHEMLLGECPTYSARSLLLHICYTIYRASCQ